MPRDPSGGRFSRPAQPFPERAMPRAWQIPRFTFPSLPLAGESAALSKGEHRPVKGRVPPFQGESVSLSKGERRPVKGRVPPCQRESVSPGKGRLTPFTRRGHLPLQGESAAPGKGRLTPFTRRDHLPLQGESAAPGKGRPLSRQAIPAPLPASFPGEQLFHRLAREFRVGPAA
jgi:hypothetical protein